MAALMEIIIKAIDKASDVSKKVGNNMQNMGDKTTRALEKASNAGTKFTETLQKTSQTGQSAYAQLTKKQQEYLQGLTKGQALADRMGISGTKMGNTIAAGYDKVNSAVTRVKTGVDTLKTKIESTTVGNKLITGFDTASQKVTAFVSKFSGITNKATEIGNKIRNSLGTALDNAKQKVENLQNNMGELGVAVTSAFGFLGVGSIYEATVGLAMVRERMSTLMTATMGSKNEAKEFVDTLDKMTNTSLVSLNDLGNAMSKIKMSTGMTNEQLKLVAPTVNDIGQRSLLMGKSTGEAQDLMTASMRGLNGEFDMLKVNFGITKKSLTDAGWSGASTDVKGYNDALQKVLAKGGDMSGMMQTTEGQIQLVKKGFSTAGRQIGEVFIPAIQMVIGFMVEIKKSNPVVFKLIIITAALVSAFALLLPVMGVIIGSFKSFLISLGLVQGAENATTLATRRATVTQKARAVANRASGIASGIAAAAEKIYSFAISGQAMATIRATIAEKARAVTTRASAIATGIMTLATTLYTGATNGQSIATKAAAISQWLLNTAMSMNPIMIVVIAIIALVAILAVLYNKNETVRNAINWLWNGLKTLGGYIMGGLMAAWNAIGGTLSWVWSILSGVGAFIAGTLLAAWNSITAALSPITSALSTLWTAISRVMSAWAQDKSKETSGTWQTLTNIAMALYGALSWVAGVLINNLKPVFDALYPVIVQIATILGGFFLAVWNTIGGVIMAVIGHIARVINIFTQLISGNITLSQALGLIWNSIKLMLAQILMSIIMNIGKWAFDLINKAKTAGIGFLNGILNYIRSLPGRLWAYLLITAARIIAFANAAREKARQAGQKIVDGIKSTIKNAPKMVWDELMRIGQRITDAGGELYNKAKKLGEDIYNGIKNALGIHSPGFMYWMLHGELGRLDTVLTDSQTILGNKASAMGDAIKDGFGTPELGIAAKVTTNKPTVMPSVAANMGDQTLLTNQTQQAITAANTTKTGVTQAYNNMGTTVTSSLTSMVNNDKSAWLKIKSTTGNQLNSIRNSTKTVTGQMVGAWKVMKDGIVDSAEKIRSQSSKKVGDLSINIRTFYDKLTHPTKWFAGPGPSGGRRSYSISGGYAGPASSSEDLLDSFLYNEAPCTDCYAGGWSFSSQNNNKIRDSLYGYNVSLPGINGLNVGDFATTTNPLMGNMKLFEAVAENLISKTGYDFYYNGRYGNLEALQRGRFNCWDGAEIMIGLANAMGIPGRMIHGKWGNIGHMAAMIGGKIFDTTQRQKRGVWRGSSGVSFAGPGPVGYTRNETSTNNDSVVINGELTLIHDLKNVPAGLDEATIAALITESLEDEGFFKKLLNNRNFLNALVKNLQTRDKRIARGGLNI